MSTQRNIISHGICDNHTRGKVADFLAEKMAAGSQLSVVSPYFTIYAYDTRKALFGRNVRSSGIRR